MGRPVALISGASRGIGRETAIALSGAGFDVALLARTEAALRQVVAEITAGGSGEGGAVAVPADVTREVEVRRAVDRVAETFGRVDVIVNNAGHTSVAPLPDLDVEAFRRVLDVHVVGAFLLVQAALPHLLASPRPHVIQVGSLASERGFAGWTAYCAAKAGLLGLSRALREELRDRRVRVTDVFVGATATDLWNDVRAESEESEARFSPERMLKPETVADAIRFAVTAPEDAAIEEIRVAPSDGVL